MIPVATVTLRMTLFARISDDEVAHAIEDNLSRICKLGAGGWAAIARIALCPLPATVVMIPVAAVNLADAMVAKIRDVEVARAVDGHSSRSPQRSVGCRTAIARSSFVSRCPPPS